MQDPLVSVIIPAYNERERIAHALESVKRQAYDRLETIVVANACSDDTARIARGLATRVIETPSQGISLAKNIGYSESSGDICSFMDADSWMGDRLLEEVVRSYHEGYDCGKAIIRPSDDDRLRAGLFCWFSEVLSRMTRYVPAVDSGAGAFTFLTRKLAKRIHYHDGSLYNPDLQVMEDVDLLTRMKTSGRYKLITGSCIYTSMRRFKEEGYLNCMAVDTFHFMLPEGKTRARWK
ncbi:MAG: glycosyltransferase [Nanoarchaeota archaeon]